MCIPAEKDAEGNFKFCNPRVKPGQEERAAGHRLKWSDSNLDFGKKLFWEAVSADVPSGLLQGSLLLQTPSVAAVHPRAASGSEG